MYAVFYLLTKYIKSKSAYIRLTILYAKIDRKAGLDYVKNALSQYELNMLECCLFSAYRLI